MLALWGKPIMARRLCSGTLTGQAPAMRPRAARLSGAFTRCHSSASCQAHLRILPQLGVSVQRPERAPARTDRHLSDSTMQAADLAAPQQQPTLRYRKLCLPGSWRWANLQRRSFTGGLHSAKHAAGRVSEKQYPLQAWCPPASSPAACCPHTQPDHPSINQSINQSNQFVVCSGAEHRARDMR